MMPAGTLAWTGAELKRVAALMAEGKSAREIGDVIGRERKAVLAQARKHKLGSWKSATGYKAADRSHIPADFETLWQTTSQADLCAHYRKGAATISHWCKKLNLVRTDGLGRGKTPAPVGFAEVARGKSRREIAEHYGMSADTVRRICADLGIVAQGVAFQPRAMSGPKLQPYHKSAMAPQRDMTRAGMAADWLRQFGPVIRCDGDGRYDPKGDHWRRGSTLLTADEVVERAYRNGWAPDAWKSLPTRMADAA